MHTSELVYVIPPYLLNTSLGASLQKKLAILDSKLAQLNCVSSSSRYYNVNFNKQDASKLPSDSKQFSSDPVLNQIVRDKLIYKLSAMGVVGVENPMKKLEEDEDYLFEIYSNTLLVDYADSSTMGTPLLGPKDGDEEYGTDGNDHDIGTGDDDEDHERAIANEMEELKTSKAKNLFNSTKLGEVNLDTISQYEEELLGKNSAWLAQRLQPKYSTKQYKKFMACPLKALLARVKADESSQAKSTPSFIEINDEFFQYPLPVTWVPLISSKYENYLTSKLGLSIDIDRGFSNISFLYNRKSKESDSKHKNKFTNFISDKSVSPSSGVFYYEIEIQQECTDATNYKPIILTNDESVSSLNSMHVCVGFTKRFSNVDFGTSHPNSNASMANIRSGGGAGGSTRTEIDLEHVKNDVDSFIYGCNGDYHQQKKPSEDSTVTEKSLASDDIENFLASQPGVLRGSFAVNFEDSLFYNSEKNPESLQRAAVLHMRRLSVNRQHLEDLDSGKLDLGVPLTTHLEKGAKNGAHDSRNKDSYHTDIIGCGINFYDKSMFYTLNGILVKIITKEDLSTSNPLSENMFFDAEVDLPKAMEKVKRMNDPNFSVSDLKSVYPIIGFKLASDLKEGGNNTINEGGTTSTIIKTNLGFKEFKFNVNNYIRNFRNEFQNSLYVSLLEKIEFYEWQRKQNGKNSSNIEASILNVDDSNIMNDLIKEYLSHEGYLKSFKSFDADLKNLQKEIGGDDEIKQEENETKNFINSSWEVLDKSEANNRQIIKGHICRGEFDLAMKFLTLNYPHLLYGDIGEKSIVFDLKLLKFVGMIKNYLEMNESSNVDETTNTTKPLATIKSEVFLQLFNFGKDLKKEYEHNVRNLESLKLVSSLFLMDNNTSLEHLPGAREFIENYTEKVNLLADEINRKILISLGFKIPTLQAIFDRVDKNIEKLSLKYCDDKFMLVNFEKDYIDL
ncbi:hypothetical protein CAAN1_06S01684 [[Candida] anglica]|uniref:LisH domain-containing protein n=1 Tax=[Candida] anglica TaxID=148631 RepID=A0ABP0EQM1_9ASCO